MLIMADMMFLGFMWHLLRALRAMAILRLSVREGGVWLTESS